MHQFSALDCLLHSQVADSRGQLEEDPSVNQSAWLHDDPQPPPPLVFHHLCDPLTPPFRGAEARDLQWVIRISAYMNAEIRNGSTFIAERVDIHP